MKIDESVLENLKDAGCDEGMIERCREMAEDGQEMIRLLMPHRRALLDALHTDQAKLDCLDYLLFQLRNAPGKG